MKSELKNFLKKQLKESTDIKDLSNVKDLSNDITTSIAYSDYY